MLYLSVTESIRFHYDRTGNLIHRELVDCEVQNYFYDRHDQLVKAEIFRDSVTGESRKLDFVIKESGKNGGGHAQEITSKTASKRSQLAKEERIRDAGGVYVRDGKSLVHIDGISEIIRLP